MKHKIFILSILLSFFSVVRAQEVVKENKEFLDKFFLSITTSPYMDFMVSPIQFHTTATGNTDIFGNPTYARIPFQSVQFNILSLGLEPRYNLKEFDDDAALTLAAPVSFGIGVTGPVDELKVRGSTGFGSVQIPVLLKLFIGNGSTYRTIRNFGFNLGAGAELNKIGLINISGESNEFNKAFILPCVTAGIVFMRGDSPMEINFKYGFGPVRSHDVDGQGNPLQDNNGLPYKRSSRGQSLKLSLVYLLNY
ncbi:MAG: hypothetical protein H6605_09460 [Flavobacteriales bacterium]|nr:hypothetical protein [Flavobacteriales bacterium]